MAFSVVENKKERIKNEAQNKINHQQTNKHNKQQWTGRNEREWDEHVVHEAGWEGGRAMC